MELPLITIDCQCGRRAVFRTGHRFAIKCLGCGAVIHEGLPKPVYKHGVKTSPVNPWDIIHDRYGAILSGYGGDWIRSNEMAWYQSEWLPLVPAGGCECKQHWTELTVSQPIDFRSALTAFDSLFELHNEVSRRFANNPTMDYGDAYRRWTIQPSMDDCCVAVTSLAPGNVDRQRDCLNSWKRLGLSISCVQSSSDVDRRLYPMVDNWREQKDASGPPTIKECLQVGQTCLLINSDVELRCDQSIIRRAIATGGLIGVRHNYNSQWYRCSKEQWGIDAFSFTPEQSSSIPDVPFRIGRPWWDYWLAELTKNDGRKWLLNPLFFHKSHDTRWSDSDWQSGARLFADHCGEYFDRGSVRMFRSRFPK